MTIIDRLLELQDEKNAAFQRKLTPGPDPKFFLGVRTPAARKLAKELKDDPELPAFLSDLPHTYFDENMLHGLILSEMKEYDACMAAVEKFLPYVDNWAVCDSMSPKVFRKHRPELLNRIRQWTASEETYTCRFGMGMLMAHFLAEAFQPEYLDIPASVQSDEYYIRMMQAWFFATALAKQWTSTLPYIEERRLSHWVHQKTIQKAVESRRITDSQKEYLKTLRY